MFKDFSKRLERDIKRVVDARIQRSIELTKKVLKTDADIQSNAIEVNVISHKRQRFAVWYGGNFLSTTDAFPKHCHTKAEYDEIGPSICRYNKVFGSVL